MSILVFTCISSENLIIQSKMLGESMDDVEINYKFYNQDMADIWGIFFVYQIQLFHLWNYHMGRMDRIYYQAKQ